MLNAKTKNMNYNSGCYQVPAELYNSALNRLYKAEETIAEYKEKFDKLMLLTDKITELANQRENVIELYKRKIDLLNLGTYFELSVNEDGRLVNNN